MTTITMTVSLCSTVLALKNGGHILKHGTDDADGTPRFFVKDRMQITPITVDLYKQLIKLKLLEALPRHAIWSLNDGSYNALRMYQYRKIWKVSDAGNAFKVPPAAFWIDDVR